MYTKYLHTQNYSLTIAVCTKYYKKGMLIKIKKMLKHNVSTANFHKNLSMSISQKSNLINTQKLLYHFAEIRDPNS